jgi:tetratricopeptide (TPR) repeat protein
VQLIERFYLRDSVETSNAYFLVGVYYFEQKLLHKAAASFQKCLAIRELRLGKTHAACADCLLNLGIIYKKLGFLNKSKDTFNECIKIREFGGNESY